MSDGPNPVADRLHRRGDGIVGFGPSPNGNGIRIWWREKNQNRSDGRKRPSGQSKPVCRPSAATIPTSGSTPSRRSPKPPESTAMFRLGRRPDRPNGPNPPTPSTGLGTVGRLRATEGGIRCDSQRYVARYCRRYLARREREMSVEGHGPIITVCRVGIAERSACSSVARGAMMRASSARRRGRWGRWTACACRGRSGRPR